MVPRRTAASRSSRPSPWPYNIPAIELDNETSKSAVANVFEKVKVGGLPLNVLALPTTSFAGAVRTHSTHCTRVSVAKSVRTPDLPLIPCG